MQVYFTLEAAGISLWGYESYVISCQHKQSETNKMNLAIN